MGDVLVDAFALDVNGTSAAPGVSTIEEDLERTTVAMAREERDPLPRELDQRVLEGGPAGVQLAVDAMEVERGRLEVDRLSLGLLRCAQECCLMRVSLANHLRTRVPVTRGQLQSFLLLALEAAAEADQAAQTPRVHAATWASPSTTSGAAIWTSAAGTALSAWCAWPARAMRPPIASSKGTLSSAGWRR